MKITVGTVFSILSDATDEEREWLNQSLSFQPKDYKKSERYIRGEWDGYHRMLNGDIFYSGLLSLLPEGFTQYLEYEDTYPRDIPDIPAELIADSNQFSDLRDYQVSTVQSAIKSCRGVIKIATGGGKTFTIASVIRILDLPTLYICNSTAALKRLYDEFTNKLGFESVGRIGGGHKDYDKKLIIALVNSVARGVSVQSERALQMLSTRGILIFDETHHLPARTWRSIGEHCPAPFRYGLSGTPFRSRDQLHYSDLTLIGLTGPMVVNISSEQLRQEGFLAEPLITFVCNPHPVVLRGRNKNNWRKIYTAGITRNPRRNGLAISIATQLYRQDYKVLIIIKEIEHGKQLLTQLRSLGVEAEFRYGGDTIYKTGEFGELVQSNESISATKARFEEATRFVLIGSQIMDEDVDIPSVNAIVLLSGGKSPIATIQRVGRGLRLKESGSNFVLVFDFLDEHPYQLLHHSNHRRRLYESEHFKVYDDLEVINSLLERPLVI